MKPFAYLLLLALLLPGCADVPDAPKVGESFSYMMHRPSEPDIVKYGTLTYLGTGKAYDRTWHQFDLEGSWLAPLPGLYNIDASDGGLPQSTGHPDISDVNQPFLAWGIQGKTEVKPLGRIVEVEVTGTRDRHIEITGFTNIPDNSGPSEPREPRFHHVLDIKHGEFLPSRIEAFYQMDEEGGWRQHAIAELMN